MRITDIQVYVDNDIACDIRIENAANLAVQTEAWLVGLYASRKVTAPVDIGAVASMGFYEAVDRESSEQMKLARSVFESSAARVSRIQRMPDPASRGFRVPKWIPVAGFVSALALLVYQLVAGVRA
jgi:hypothetical protein